MNAHALRVLELEKVLERVASRATSDLGRERVRELRPATDRAFLVEELERVEEMVRYLELHPSWSPPRVPDARATLRRLEVEGAVLEAVELHAVGRLLASGRHLARGLARDAEELPRLAGLRHRVHEDEEAEEAIEKTVDRDGSVLDTASKELRRIRQSLRQAHSRIVRRLEEFLETLSERIRVSDASVSLREGRYVIPIRREGKAEVGGIVHGESASGATLFVEPQMAVELMNAVKELEQEEAREIQRILREFTGRLRPDRLALEEAQKALVDFDSLWARARCARQWSGAAPELLPGDARELEIAGGRHPLLVEQDDHDVVPFDLRLDPHERAVVVSGPNTGGKTVFLKALGLTATLAQSGVIPPVGPGSRLPVFDDIFADIGDEQSIAESLSTFSAHLENLMEIVEGADARSLVLIDEMGTGTDPSEGAALARAILEELVARDALSVVSSHLGALKHLDREDSGIVNASLQFDPDRMEPTYRLVKGRPGRSYGLAIARRLGFPGAVLDRAETHLSEGEASVEALLEKLERQEKEAEELVAELERERSHAERLRRELEKRGEELEERERTAERRAREEARELLLEAREEVEEAIQEVRTASEREAVEDAARRARGRVEEAARRQREERPSRDRPPGPAPDLEPGDRVRLQGGGTKGVVIELRKDRAVVEASGVRLQLPVAELRLVEEGGGEESALALEEATERARSDGGWTGPEAEPATEIDVRGLRVYEAEREVNRALDQAVLGDLGEIRIIHGKGTGALRQMVRELLEGDGRIAEFRSGRPGEGGAGVTVVSIR